MYLYKAFVDLFIISKEKMGDLLINNFTLYIFLLYTILSRERYMHHRIIPGSKGIVV